MLIEITSKVCGHTYEKDIVKFGGGEYTRESAARKKAAWWEDKACLDCWKGEKKTELAKFDTNDLPELEGSEKQVNWAKSLRPKVLKVVDDCVNLMFDSMSGPEDELVEDMREHVAKKITLLKRVKEAKFWIEVREYTGDAILKLVDLKLESVATVWYAKPRMVTTNSGYRRMVGGTKPRYTEYALA
jgi:hypothetical protein